MMMNENDLQVLRALDAARAEHKELADLLDFYYDLYQAQFEAKAQIPEPEVRDDLADDLCRRLEAGIPQVTFDQLHLEPGQFSSHVGLVTDLVLRHNPGWQVERAEWTPESLIALARELFESRETLTAPQPGKKDGEPEAGRLMTLVVGLTLVPYLQRAAEAVMPHLDMSLWTRGYCPICGGRPDLALLGSEASARQLLCTRCTSLWNYSRVGCPFCGAKERQIYYLGENGLYRLYVCPECKGYLKTVDLQQAKRPVQPMVERLLTVSMDLAAWEEGWGNQQQVAAAD